MSETLDQLKAHLGDRYRIERELGRGGMATVYLATDIRHDREVAIKVLHPDLAATIGSERFEREIKLAAKLQHPHILGMYDSGSADGLLYYVMPFVKGESVRDMLDREKQLSIDEAVQITLEVADALGYAHSQGIIHRDIKPENVLMSNGHALVADFGIARARQEAGQQRLTQTGMAVGTPVYMSPEQATGENVGPAADIYSLGCMLFELLAGEPPFTGPNAMVIMARHAMEGVPSVRIVRPSVPEEVEDAIYAAMEKSVADRPKSAADFCDILGTPLGTTATRRITPSARHTASRRIPTAPVMGARQVTLPVIPVWRRWPFLGGSAVAVVGAAFGIFKLATGGGGGPAPTLDPLARKVAVRYFNVEGGDVELRAAADRLTESLIRDLSTARALTVVSPNGVAAYRGSAATRDSVASALNVGTMVEGTIEPDGDGRVTISARIYDRSGTNLGQSIRIPVSRDSLVIAEQEIARRVSNELRGVLGSEIETSESRAGTRNTTAWTLFNRAERARREAAGFGRGNPDSARARLATSDSLLNLARQADDRWIEPALQQVQVALDRANYVPAGEVGVALDTALGRVSTALQVDPSSGRATELRGTIKFQQWRVGRLSLDPVVRDALLNDAEADLLRAIQLDDRLVTPYATLAFLYYDKKDVPASLTQARTAYQADAFLSNSQAILQRLFYGSYDTELFADAKKWCDEGGTRFPRNFHFTLCHLWLMLERSATPDVPRAWQLAARIDSIEAGPLVSHMAGMIVGGVIGREAMAMAAGPEREARLDSARRVLERASGDRSVDPGQELPGYRAIMHAQFGDNAKAIQLLTAYVAANPDHSFRVGGNVHWWWRNLRDERGFTALEARRR